MPRLIRNRTLVDDRYTLLREAASLRDVPDGFDAIAIPDSLDADDALAGFAGFSDGYHATAMPVPWLDRRQPSTPTGDFGFPCA